jgi:hypothetical protein
MSSTSTPCVLASQFAAQSALSALAGALDASAGKIICEKQRQEAVLAGLPALPAETVDGALAAALGMEAVRGAMATARTALTGHIDGLTILLGVVASQREQVARMAASVARAPRARGHSRTAARPRAARRPHTPGAGGVLGIGRRHARALHPRGPGPRHHRADEPHEV